MGAVMDLDLILWLIAAGCLLMGLSCFALSSTKREAGKSRVANRLLRASCAWICLAVVVNLMR